MKIKYLSKIIDRRAVLLTMTFIFYPVYIEEFDFKEDLPNNWSFNLGYTKDDFFEAEKDGKSNGNLWMGNPYGEGNIITNNGIGYLKTIKLNSPIYDKANDDVDAKNYFFTGGLLKSNYDLKQGVFEIKIRIPENPNFWPAYWLFNGINEIDVCEFFEGKGKNSWEDVCNTYHQFKMTQHHHKYLNNKCSRGRKFPVTKKPNNDPEDFFYSWHIIKCLWTDYRIDIYLDGNLVGYSRRFYDGPFTPPPACQKGADSEIPLYNRDCNYMSNSNSCNLWAPWPFNNTCIKWNKAYRDNSWPNTINPMKLILNNAINYNLNNVSTNLYNSWSSFLEKDKELAVDWIKIYQPINCDNIININTEAQFKNTTGGTNFLSGSNVTISDGMSNNKFFIEPWKNFPIHILASEKIAFLNETDIEEGNFLRAEIIDCSGGFNQYQRGMEGEEPLFLTDEEIAEIEKKELDSLLKANPEFMQEYLEYMKLNGMPDKKSQVDNGAIVLYPNPSIDKINVGMAEEDYYDLSYMEIIDALGRTKRIEKASEVNVKQLSAGLYQLKFVFSHGFIVVKSFIKADN